MIPPMTTIPITTAQPVVPIAPVPPLVPVVAAVTVTVTFFSFDVTARESETVTVVLYTPALSGAQVNEEVFPAQPRGSPAKRNVSGAVPPAAVTLNQMFVPTPTVDLLTLNDEIVGSVLTETVRFGE